jgi:hypothetical protein
MRITSFPDPADIRSQGKGVRPTGLNGGFLLDNRGIGPDVAYLSLTWEEYAAMNQAPNPETLSGLIAEKDPVVSMFRCHLPDRSEASIAKLNEMIRAGRFSDCEKIK